MQKTLIKKGRLVDPKRDIDETMDIRVCGGIVRELSKNIKANEDDHVVNAKGKIVSPGLIDTHCHLREPGREDEETIESGTLAAVAGGFYRRCGYAEHESCNR